jgi:hypothetical protein
MGPKLTEKVAVMRKIIAIPALCAAIFAIPIAHRSELV